MGEWRGYGRFIKRPVLPEKANGFSMGGLIAVLRLLALDLVFMTVITAIALTATSMGFEMPENELENITFDAGMIAVVVLAVPVFEEVMFRLWLSGKTLHVLLPLIIVLGMLALVLSGTGTAPLLPIALAAAFLVLVLVLGRTGAYRRLFPLFFFISSFGFALVHLVNYQEGSLLLLLPLVIPQLIAGTLFGYVRTAHGLWAAILFHALHNGIALGSFLFAQNMGWSG